MPIEVQETSSTPHIHNQNRTSPMLYLKWSTENKERIKKAAKEMPSNL
jgi:hypothetical protein